MVFLKVAQSFFQKNLIFNGPNCKIAFISIFLQFLEAFLIQIVNFWDFSFIFGDNGRESTVNRALDGSIYPG